MLDDRGQPVRVLNPAGFSDWPVQHDERVASLVRRMGIAMQGGGMLRRVGVQVALAVGGIAIAVLIIGVLRRFLPGLPSWVPLIAIGFSGSIGGVFFVRVMTRANQAALAAVIIEEGLCPSCGYNFFGLTPDHDGCMVCPECSAAWRAARIGRSAPFDAAAKEGEVFAALRSGASGANTWTTTDDRGRRVELAHPRLRKPLKSCRDDHEAERLRAARAAIARASRWMRGIVLTGLWAAALMVIGLLAFRIIGRGGSGGVMVVLSSLLLVALPLAATLGNFCYSPACTRRTLLDMGLCATCVASLDGQPVEADGCRTCPRCRSSWRVGSSLREDVA